MTAAAKISCELIYASVTARVHEFILGVETPSVDRRWLARLQIIHVEDGLADGILQQLCVQVEDQSASSPEFE